MGRPTRTDSILLKAENQHIQFTIDHSRHSSQAARVLGITLRTLYIKERLGTIQMKPESPSPEVHPLSRYGMTLFQFKIAVVAEALAKFDGNITHTAKFLGTTNKSIYNWTDPDVLKEHRTSLPPKIMKPIAPEELPVAFKNNKPDLPKSRITQKARDSQEVSISVSPEERDEYYNYDFPWGTYSRMSRKIYPEDRPLPHALGYGEDL